MDLDLAMIAGGNEETAPGQSFAITDPIVNEVLRSGLFVAYDDSRVLFRHSSIAAFLAAAYIVKRKVDGDRLASLFLVKSPDDDENSIIPTPLRETAAWLVALDPNNTEWLASADAESLAVHSALVQSDRIRELIVSRLLARAGDVEVSSAAWYYRHWDLKHPGLSGQLVAALEVEPGNVVASWDERARIRVALRLAQECPTPELTTPLLGIMQDDRWPYPERLLATTAAFDGSPDECVAPLRQLLVKLEDAEYASRMDPNDELRGTALSLLWPDYVDIKDLLGWVTTPQNEAMIGAYSRFLRTMADSCSDEDIYDVLQWLNKIYEGAQTSITPKLSATDDESGEAQEYRSLRVGPRLFSRGSSTEQLFDASINRALTLQNVDKCLPLMASVIVRRLQEYEPMHMPAVLDETALEDQEKDKAVSLRRALLVALVRAAADSSEHRQHMVWAIVNEWKRSPSFSWSSDQSVETLRRSRLADPSDFEWVLAQAHTADAAGDVEVADLFGRIASFLFNREDRYHFELAYDHRRNPAWPYIEWFYSGIDIDSDLARAWRRNHEANRRPEWPQSANFLNSLRDEFQAAKGGNTTSFWRLLWFLQIDPRTGEGQVRFDDDFLSWPGTEIFDSGDRADLIATSHYYLDHECDHGSDWLGHLTIDKRARAGYLALALLCRDGELARLSRDRWARWTAAVLGVRLSSPGEAGNSIRPTLLREAAVNAAREFALDFCRQVRVEASQGQHTWDVQLLDPSWSRELAAAMECLACDLTEALISSVLSEGDAKPSLEYPHTHVGDGRIELPSTPEARTAAARVLSDLLGLLAANGSMLVGATAEYVFDFLEAHQLRDFSAAVVVARTLLWSDAAAAWERVRGFVHAYPNFGRELAGSCATSDVKTIIEASLNVAQLEDVYLWLNSLYPQDDLVFELGASWGRSDAEAGKWRDGVANAIARRGTAEAIASLKSLVNRFPERLALRASLVQAKVGYAEAGASRPLYETIVAMLESPSDQRAVYNYFGDHVNFSNSTFYGPVVGKYVDDATPDSDGCSGPVE
ncbi:hypothetical protein ACQEUU_05885 [Nonomuraea sp. CA-218870]|uniref:hypothetical protein n=1 Tax=Nonomuraea sp. CA-218870 TaxID=3239998 RepID=UPI003D8F1278